MARDSAHSKIYRRISGYERGRILFPSNFFDLAAETAVKMTLSRLSKNGELHRLGQGIYLYPKSDPEMGILLPSIEDIAEAISKRDRIKIIPTGDYALHRLGISTQVPMKVVYLTDGAPRKIKVGKRIIIFKKTTPKRLLVKGRINQLVIQALLELGEKSVTPEIRSRIFDALANEDPLLIKKDALIAPAWISKVMRNFLAQKSNEKLD